MKLRIKPGDGFVRVYFREVEQYEDRRYDFLLYISDIKLASRLDWCWSFMDGSNAVVVSQSEIAIIPYAMGSGHSDGWHKAKVFRVSLDTARFFRALRIVREKQVKCEWDLASFENRVTQPARLTVQQILKHPNAENYRSELTRTLINFRRKMPARGWSELIDTLSRYLPIAKVWGTYNMDEIGFNGRIPGGCGYNGGIILREGDERGFSIHT